MIPLTTNAVEQFSCAVRLKTVWRRRAPLLQVATGIILDITFSSSANIPPVSTRVANLLESCRCPTYNTCVASRFLESGGARVHEGNVLLHKISGKVFSDFIPESL